MYREWDTDLVSAADLAGTEPRRDADGLMTAAYLDDTELRRELVYTHRVEAAARDHALPGQRALLEVRLAELDCEYLRRFPLAAQRWPWPSTHNATA